MISFFRGAFLLRSVDIEGDESESSYFLLMEGESSSVGSVVSFQIESSEKMLVNSGICAEGRKSSRLPPDEGERELKGEEVSWRIKQEVFGEKSSIVSSKKCNENKNNFCEQFWSSKEDVKLQNRIVGGLRTVGTSELETKEDLSSLKQSLLELEVTVIQKIWLWDKQLFKS